MIRYLLALLPIFLPVAVSAAPFVVSVEKIGALTGPTSPSDMIGPDICGTDLGTITELGERLYFAFGDTFGHTGTACSRFGPNWRSNVLAHTEDKEASDGITLDGWLTGSDGTAVAVSEGKHQRAFTGTDGEQSRIPTAMVTVGTRLYLHYMSVHGFAPRGGEWSCNFSRFAYSDDRGATWREAMENFGDNASRFNMLALSSANGRGNEAGSYVYAIGTACGRFGAGYAARVETDKVLDPSAWRYYDGTAWVSDPGSAVAVIPPIAGEGSLAWNAGLGRWMYTTLNQDHEAIELHLADDPWGPWTETYTLVSGKDYAQIYGAFMSPSLIAADGKSFYFIMSQFGPYEAYVMRARLAQ